MNVAVRALHLCSGYGGFELALRPFEPRTVAHVERDSHAAAVLVARMADETLDQAPVWDDLTTFDGRPWRGTVDLITAGLPCQPFSGAGQRRGLDDERHLWPHARRIIADVAPGVVILENVPDVVRAGWLGGVLGDLADLGFDAEWGVLAASDVGAPHRRRRFWLLAYTDRDRLQGFRWQSDDNRDAWNDVDGSGGADVGRADRTGRSEVTGRPSCDESTEGWREDRADFVVGAGEDVADAESVDEREPDRETGTDARQRARSDARWHGFPPRPDDHTAWAEWVTAGGPEPQLRRVPDGTTGRLVRPAGLADRLHLLGNGLVPQCATEAIRQLAERALT